MVEYKVAISYTRVPRISRRRSGNLRQALRELGRTEKARYQGRMMGLASCWSDSYLGCKTLSQALPLHFHLLEVLEWFKHSAKAAQGRATTAK